MWKNSSYEGSSLKMSDLALIIYRQYTNFYISIFTRQFISVLKFNTVFCRRLLAYLDNYSPLLQTHAPSQFHIANCLSKNHDELVYIWRCCSSDDYFNLSIFQDFKKL